MTASDYDLEKILARIQKLHAKAESAREIGSEAEAQSFADAVQKMLVKYKLEMTDVELAAQKDHDPLSAEWVDFAGLGIPRKSRRVPWSEHLAHAVADAHFCKLIVGTRSNRVQFVGRHSDRLVAEYVFARLYKTAEKQADRAYDVYFGMCRQLGMVEKARGYRATWLTGFVTRVMQRYQEQKRALEGGSMALVRVRKEVDDFYDQIDAEEATAKRMEAKHAAAMVDGFRAGQEVSLTADGLGGGERAKGQLR